VHSNKIRNYELRRIALFSPRRVALFSTLLSGCRVWTSVPRAHFTFRATLVEIFLSLRNIPFDFWLMMFCRRADCMDLLRHLYPDFCRRLFEQDYLNASDAFTQKPNLKIHGLFEFVTSKVLQRLLSLIDEINPHSCRWHRCSPSVKALSWIKSEA